MSLNRAIPNTCLFVTRKSLAPTAFSRARPVSVIVSNASSWGVFPRQLRHVRIVRSKFAVNRRSLLPEQQLCSFPQLSEFLNRHLQSSSFKWNRSHNSAASELNTFLS